MPFVGKCGNAAIQARKFKETDKKRKTLAPKPLPGRRPRALTIRAIDDDVHDIAESSKWYTFWGRFERKKIHQRTFEQTQSSLLSKLPEEIRRCIWKYVLGGHWLHVVRAPHRLVAISCPENPVFPTITRLHHCWNVDTVRGGFAPDFWDGPRHDSTAKPANLLSLLLTCRVVYSEGINILYKDNTFDFNHLDTIINLSQTTLPARLRLIQSICLHWDFKYLYPSSHWWVPPYNTETWDEACDILARLVDLKELSLYLTGYPTFLPHGEYMLRPLWKLRAPKRFDVIIPSTARREEVDLDDAPFQLIGDWDCEGAWQGLW